MAFYEIDTRSKGTILIKSRNTLDDLEWRLRQHGNMAAYKIGVFLDEKHFQWESPELLSVEDILEIRAVEPAPGTE